MIVLHPLTASSTPGNVQPCAQVGLAAWGAVCIGAAADAVNVLHQLRGRRAAAGSQVQVVCSEEALQEQLLDFKLQVSSQHL